MITLPTIEREVVVPIIGGVEALGGDVDGLLEDAGFLKEWLAPKTMTIPESRVWKLFELASRRLDMAEIGLQAGFHLRIRDLGQFGRQLAQSLTLFHCLNEYISSVNAVSSHAEFWIEQETGGIWFCRHGIDLIEDGREFVEQFTVQLMIRLVQQATGSDWTPTKIRIQATTDSVYRSFGTFDSAEVLSGNSATGIWIPSVEMLRLVRRDDDPIVRLIREAVSVGTDEERPCLVNTANRIGFSKRTLQRELNNNGLDWSRLLEQIRLHRAIDLIEATEMKLGDVAYELGYVDPSNFGRAFRRWTGVTPGEYRKHLRWRNSKLPATAS